ncbi:hypothetical protein [Psychromonas sp.]|uniref:hypothetical protein n=1 Tax=Psychromonas sp. TaxID=1884585 RepID=UPI0035693EE6
MFSFTKDFNCCKTVRCKNFAVADSADYIPQSWRLGYLSIACKSCGSYPPWVNNEQVKQLLAEKLEVHFARKLSDCPGCAPYFFFNESPKATLHGYTSAGRQRKKCSLCQRVFTPACFKNRNALRLILSCIIANKEIRESIKETGLSARLYYFYLEKLAQIFASFSRLKEEQVMLRPYLALHTHGKVLHLAHQRGFYTLLTSEVDSGYIVLQTNNLTNIPLTEEDIYRSRENTIISADHEPDLETRLINRYEQNLTRKHFEQLLVGELKPLTKCALISPAELVYAHFQLLTAFTVKASTYRHYIEHESCLRAAALMASAADIKKSAAEVYFFLAHPRTENDLQGKKIGWWDDKWFSNDSGAYCPIATASEFDCDVKLDSSTSIDQFYAYLDKKIYKGVNSLNVVNHLSEIHRVIFNYCDVNNNSSRAVRLGVCDAVYTPLQLLDSALSTVTKGF